MHDAEHHSIIIVGAGPGGLAVAAALLAEGLSPRKLMVLDKGEVGQAWLDYPAETHLLSESAETFDHNMIADIPFKDVFPHIPHPSHELYQKYLQEIVTQLKIQVTNYVEVKKVIFEEESKRFYLKTADQREFTADYVVWAAGMFSTPVDTVESEKCYVHYAKVPDFEKVRGKEITVVGSGNGASGVVMALAKPGRHIRLLVPHTYEIPQPIDCLWKENMEFVRRMENQGLVDIIENFRVASITKDGEEFLVRSTDGAEQRVPQKPILCIGFEPTIQPLGELIGCVTEGHDWALEIDKHNESKKQPGLFVAGTLGRHNSEQAFIREFRKFGPIIARKIMRDQHETEE
jgi:thioredoxin reductase